MTATAMANAQSVTVKVAVRLLAHGQTAGAATKADAANHVTERENDDETQLLTTNSRQSCQGKMIIPLGIYQHLLQLEIRLQLGDVLHTGNLTSIDSLL